MLNHHSWPTGYAPANTTQDPASLPHAQGTLLGHVQLAEPTLQVVFSRTATLAVSLNMDQTQMLLVILLMHTCLYDTNTCVCWHTWWELVIYLLICSGYPSVMRWEALLLWFCDGPTYEPTFQYLSTASQKYKFLVHRKCTLDKKFRSNEDNPSSFIL